ncbi:hypothetical protein C0992_005747 [Termitomyces sp. T32_za158]|nr:hypothetical protein C0992_005747 [Termitomyces sp. T32_za158]
MITGSLEQSLDAKEMENLDFERLKDTSDVLQELLAKGPEGKKWRDEGRLLLSVGIVTTRLRDTPHIPRTPTPAPRSVPVSPPAAPPS